MLLASALEKAGDDVAAAQQRELAWKDHDAAPRFQRRKSRVWAWRAKPSRPLAYAVAMGLSMFLLWQVAGPTIRNAVESSAGNSPYADETFE